MATYQPVHVKLYNDPWYLGLPAAARHVFLYLLTTPANPPSGIFSCPAKKIAFDTGLTVRRVEGAIEALCCEDSGGRRHVQYDSAEALVWIVNSSGYWTPNENVLKAMKKQVDALNGHPFAAAWHDRHGALLEPLRNGQETVS